MFVHVQYNFHQAQLPSVPCVTCQGDGRSTKEIVLGVRGANIVLCDGCCLLLCPAYLIRQRHREAVGEQVY